MKLKNDILQLETKLKESNQSLKKSTDAIKKLEIQNKTLINDDIEKMKSNKIHIRYLEPKKNIDCQILSGPNSFIFLVQLQAHNDTSSEVIMIDKYELTFSLRSNYFKNKLGIVTGFAKFHLEKSVKVKLRLWFEWDQNDGTCGSTSKLSETRWILASSEYREMSIKLEPCPPKNSNIICSVEIDEWKYI